MLIPEAINENISHFFFFAVCIMNRPDTREANASQKNRNETVGKFNDNKNKFL